MEYLIGVVLSLAVAAFAVAVGFDRERAFYPTMMIVIASYYVLFAAIGLSSMGATAGTLGLEITVATVFLLLAVAGYRRNAWLVVVAMAGHSVFDFFHHFLIQNPGMPRWWPGFCLSFDGTMALWVALRQGKPATKKPSAQS